MKTVIRTYAFEYDELEPGDIVTPSSRRSSLEFGKKYKVVSFHPPHFEYGEMSGTVFVEGEEYGIDARYLMLVEEKLYERP